MSDVLRILDRFRITGRGIVYTVKINKDAYIRMGDVLSDLRGNRFEVSGIEMCRRKMQEGKTLEDIPLGLMFKQWNFGLYVSGFWHIHAKTPRGIVVCEQ